MYMYVVRLPVIRPYFREWSSQTLQFWGKLLMCNVTFLFPIYQLFRSASSFLSISNMICCNAASHTTYITSEKYCIMRCWSVWIVGCIISGSPRFPSDSMPRFLFQSHNSPTLHVCNLSVRLRTAMFHISGLSAIRNVRAAHTTHFRFDLRPAATCQTVIGGTNCRCI